MSHPVPSAPGSRAASAGPSRVIGLLGGIASGKTAAGRALAGPDGVLIEADRIARAVLDSPAVRMRLLCEFGGGVFGPDGRPDRERLAARVFASHADRERLESFTHPAIRERIRAELKRARAAGIRRIVLDVPLLLENESAHGLADECDVIVFVDADDASRDARAVRSRGWASGEVLRREATQIPLAAKRARADRVIVNQGTLVELEAAAARLAAEIVPDP